YLFFSQVACWNTARGCGFIDPVESLLDHYKECDFSIVPCCLCRAPVLQSDILEHFENGCNSHQALCEPTDDNFTQDLKDVNRTCVEMKKVMGKISEDLMSLQTTLNRCGEDLRAESAECKDQWEAEASRLAEQLKTGFSKDLKLLQAAIVDYKEHVSKELCLQGEKMTVVSEAVTQSVQSQCRPKRVHWYIENGPFSETGLENRFKSVSSPTRDMYDYSVSQCVELEQTDDKVRFGSYLCIYPGDRDLQLEWPFRKVYTLGVVHPKDQSNVICYKADPDEAEDQTCFQRPKGKKNLGFGKKCLSTTEELKKNGFVHNDSLHMFLEIEA
ncbi:unnamed protein product, partial [Ixodes hexagonus]